MTGFLDPVPLAYCLPLHYVEALHELTDKRIGVLVESLAEDHEALDAPCVRDAVAEALALHAVIGERARWSV